MQEKQNNRQCGRLTYWRLPLAYRLQMPLGVVPLRCSYPHLLSAKLLQNPEICKYIFMLYNMFCIFLWCQDLAPITWTEMPPWGHTATAG